MQATIASESLRPASQPRDLPKTFTEALQAFYHHPSPWILTLLVITVSSLRLWLGDFGLVDALIAAGVLLYWPLNEWLIHVLLLHFRPRRFAGRQWDLAVSRKHRRHHRNPWDLTLVFIPLRAFSWAIPALAALAWLITPTWNLALSFLGVYLILSLHYEWSHFLAHIAWCPKLGYYQQRVREHRLHHFRNEKYWWGVSTGLGDCLLGTAPPSEQVPRSETTGSLGIG